MKYIELDIKVKDKTNLKVEAFIKWENEKDKLSSFSGRGYYEGNAPLPLDFFQKYETNLGKILIKSIDRLAGTFSFESTN